jgi:two-component system sensor kinase FixL
MTICNFKSVGYYLFFAGGRRAILARVAFLTALIAFLDANVYPEAPLGILYLLPMLLGSVVLNRVQIIPLVALYTILSEFFGNYKYEQGVPATILRDATYLVAFWGIGLLAIEVRTRLRAAEFHLAELERAAIAQQGIEEQLENMIVNNPAAILTADGEGRILISNEAAHKLFGTREGALVGAPISRYLPSLSSVSILEDRKRPFRTVMQCKGHRTDNSIFLADVWFSIYRTTAGPRLSAMIIDSSQELRDREESGLQHLLTGSRILGGAFAHETRNICSAIAIVHQNLSRRTDLQTNPDFEALGTLVLALKNIASLELRQKADRATSMDLKVFFEELRIIIEPSLFDAKINTDWVIPQEKIQVWADRQGLIQVFLNLIKNSESALSDQPNPSLTITITVETQSVFISIIDNGKGVANPESLFRPFQTNSDSTGLGLYLSRALLHSFRGELHYQPSSEGAIFIVELSRLADVTQHGDLHNV